MYAHFERARLTEELGFVEAEFRRVFEFAEMRREHHNHALAVAVEGYSRLLPVGGDGAIFISEKRKT